MPTSPRGLSAPTTTPVPDELFDYWLSRLTGAQLKVALYICRRTFGFRKDEDAISLSQICTGITKRDGTILDKGTGLSRSTAIVAVAGLVELGVIEERPDYHSDGGRAATVYRLCLRQPDLSENRIAWSENPTTPGPIIELPLVRKSDPQQTVVQQTENNKQSDIHNAEKTEPALVDPNGFDVMLPKQDHPTSEAIRPGKGGTPPRGRVDRPALANDPALKPLLAELLAVFPLHPDLDAHNALAAENALIYHVPRADWDDLPARARRYAGTQRVQDGIVQAVGTWLESGAYTQFAPQAPPPPPIDPIDPLAKPDDAGGRAWAKAILAERAAKAAQAQQAQA